MRMKRRNETQRVNKARNDEQLSENGKGRNGMVNSTRQRKVRQNEVKGRLWKACGRRGQFLLGSRDSTKPMLRAIYLSGVKVLYAK